MSTYYIFYTEGKIGGKWTLLDSYNKDIKTGDFKINPTYENFSRSYFWDAYNKITEICEGKIKQSELSDGLREHFDKNDEEYKEEVGQDYVDNFERDLTWIELNALEDMLKDGEYTRHGFIHKDQIAAYKAGDAEYLFADDDNQEEFLALSPEERSKVYTYMEWDDFDDWRYQFKEIKASAYKHINDFKGVNFLSDISDIRLIMYIC